MGLGGTLPDDESLDAISRSEKGEDVARPPVHLSRRADTARAK